MSAPTTIDVRDDGLQVSDTKELTCHPFPASTQIPRADF